MAALQECSVSDGMKVAATGVAIHISDCFETAGSAL
jgi:hypothetical protein